MLLDTSGSHSAECRVVSIGRLSAVCVACATIAFRQEVEALRFLCSQALKVGGAVTGGHNESVPGNKF